MTLEQKPLPGNLDARMHALPSPDARVELLWCDLRADDALARALAPWLSGAERARAARFGIEALRHRYVIGRAALRAALARRLSLQPGAVPLTRGRRGRPQLAQTSGLDFNVSHTGDALLIGIAQEITIGLDVERSDRVINTDGIAKRCLSDSERGELAALDSDAARQRVLRLWTCKEAMSKATGDALAAPFRWLSVDLEPAPRLRAGPPPYQPTRWTLHAIAVPQPYLATLAVWSGGAFGSA